MAKCKASKECFWTALVEWRLAPRSDGPSPAQLFVRIQVRSGRLPEIHGPLDIKEDIQQKEDSQRRSRVRATVNHATPQMALHQHVLLQDRESKEWSIKGQIRAIRPIGRSYVVRTESGTFLRGIRFVKPDVRAEVFRVVSAGSRPALCSGISTARSSQARKKVTCSSSPPEVVL